MSGRIRGEQIRDESIDSADLMSGSIKAGEVDEQVISGQPVLGSADTTNDRLLIWDANGSPTGSLKQIAPANLGIGGGGSPAGSDTQIQFNDGGSSFGASSNLTWDDTALKISGTGTNPIFSLETTEDGSTASPVLALKRNSSSPAAADYLAQIKFLGENSSDSETTYAKITGKIGDSGAGGEAGILEFANISNGAQVITARLRYDSLQLLNNTNLSVDGTAEISQYLYHKGDTDTYIQFSDDEIEIAAGGRTFIKIQESSTDKLMINNGGLDIDLQVKGENNANLIRTDAAIDTVGINTSTPKCSLSISGSLALNVKKIDANNDPGTTYSVVTTDCVILVNTRPTAQNGIDSAITITLPDASDYPGRVVTIKDSAGYCETNSITIAASSGDNIEGNPLVTSTALPTDASFKKMISDGSSSWYEIGS